MCWFPFFKSSKKRKKPASKRERVSEKDARSEESDHRRGRAQAHSAQTAPYGTFVANPPVRTRKPKIRVDVPQRAHREVYEHGNSSSTEMLLNPRPERSRQHRQRHPKSTTTLRGRGAKRDPPTKRKLPGQSKKMPTSKSTRKQEWSRIRSPSTSTSSSHKRRRHHHHHRDTSTQQTYQYEAQPSPSAQPYQYQYQDMQQYTQHYHQPYASPLQASPPQQQQQQQQQQQYYTYQPQPPSSHSRQRTQPHRARSRSHSRPNTSARRLPDGRFAVRAATNQALEDIRREAFLASPPPRTWGYGGTAAVYTTETPFHWDCVTVSSGSGPRRERRRGRR